MKKIALCVLPAALLLAGCVNSADQSSVGVNDDPDILESIQKKYDRSSVGVFRRGDDDHDVPLGFCGTERRAGGHQRHAERIQ